MSDTKIHISLRALARLQDAPDDLIPSNTNACGAPWIYGDTVTSGRIEVDRGQLKTPLTCVGCMVKYDEVIEKLGGAR